VLDLDADHIWMEIKASEDLRKRHVSLATRLVKSFVGNYYRTDMRTKPVPENLFFTYLATMLPNICFDNPAVTVSAKRMITHDAIARFMEMGLNGWIKEVRLRDEIEAAMVDMLFSFGVLKTGIEPRSDFNTGIRGGVQERFTMDALMPYCVRISPSNFIVDSQCAHWQTARLLGHQFQRDAKDMRGDERYDQKVVKAMTPDDEPFPGRSQEERITPKSRTDVHRDRCTLYELYFPEYQKIGTLALYGGSGTERSAWVREPTAYHGPAEGPFSCFGVYVVPDQVYPLSPIAAFAEQALELNAHAGAAAKEAASHKRIVLADAAQTELLNLIQRAENGGVFGVKGLNAQQVIQLELGGAQQDRLEYLQMLLARTDRLSGQSDAIRGRPAGVTATEASLVDANSDARTEFIHLKARQGVKDALSKVGWYLYHDPSVVMPVSMRDPMTNQPFEGLFLGGIQPGQEDSNWSDLFLDIEPYSMRRVDPAVEQQRAQMLVALVAEISPMIMQFPFVNWTNILDMIGQAHNIPDFAQQIFNQNGIQLLQQQGNQIGPPGTMQMAGPGATQALGPGANQGVQLAAGGAPVAGMPSAFPGWPANRPGTGGGGGGGGGSGFGVQGSGGAAPGRPAGMGIGPGPGATGPGNALQAGNPPPPPMTPGTPQGVVPFVQRLGDKLLALRNLKTLAIGSSPDVDPGNVSAQQLLRIRGAA